MRTIIAILWLLIFAVAAPVCYATEVQTLIFPSQKPVDNHPWTVPTTGTYQCTLSVDEMVVKWVEPSTGVTSDTGVLVILQGISLAADCNKSFLLWDDTWADSRNLIICNIYYRNVSFSRHTILAYTKWWTCCVALDGCWSYIPRQIINGFIFSGAVAADTSHCNWRHVALVYGQKFMPTAQSQKSPHQMISPMAIMNRIPRPMDGM